MADNQRVDQVAQYLSDLLVGRRAYRSLWEHYVQHPTTTELSQAAVARVIADHLVDAGERHDEPDLHRSLKDRVARALSGRGITAETLTWFIDAFAMTDEDAFDLRSLLSDTMSPPLVAGRWPIGARREAKEPRWRTLAIHELHHLGPDGFPATHRTMQVIRARVDGLANYLYRFDTNALSVEVVRGGTPGPVQDLGDGIFGIDIQFPAALRAGETASLEYVTTFCYREPPAPEFRRAVLRRVDNIEVRVQFDANRVPQKIWWGRWHALDGPMVKQELVQVDPEAAVHRYLAGVESAIVGFSWQW